jgi:hypothetical protein
LSSVLSLNISSERHYRTDNEPTLVRWERFADLPGSLGIECRVIVRKFFLTHSSRVVFVTAHLLRSSGIHLEVLVAERHREEVLNTVLATCLGKRGVDADPETILRKGRVRPDVMAIMRGLRCAIEGKVGDTTNAEAAVLGDVKKRLDQGVAHLAIGVVYPTELRTTAFRDLPRLLSAAKIKFCVLTDADQADVVKAIWHEGAINEILAELHRAHDVIVRDDVLQNAVDILNIGLAEVSHALMGNKGACDRLIKVLGVGTKGKTDASSTV